MFVLVVCKHLPGFLGHLCLLPYLCTTAPITAYFTTWLDPALNLMNNPNYFLLIAGRDLCIQELLPIP